MSAAEVVVEAAGGLVHRDGEGGPEIALVHRPRYDDWTLPKGKLAQGETYQEAALREVEEETGLRCRLVRYLGSVRYLDRSGKTKRVKYWLMEPIDGTFVPAEEVDELRWLGFEAAEEMLSYDHDRELVRAFVNEWDGGRMPAGVTAAYLVRHAKAGVRSEWPGPDELRPLTARGRKQARGLVKALDDFPIARILSSPALRCVQTVEPLADARGLKVEECDALAQDADAMQVRGLILESPDTVICTHREVIENLLEALGAEGVSLEDGLPRGKGSTWVIRIEDGRVASGRYLPPLPASGPNPGIGPSTR